MFPAATAGHAYKKGVGNGGGHNIVANSHASPQEGDVGEARRDVPGALPGRSEEDVRADALELARLQMQQGDDADGTYNAAFVTSHFCNKVIKHLIMSLAS